MAQAPFCRPHLVEPIAGRLAVHSLIYIVGLIVVVLAILSLFGLA